MIPADRLMRTLARLQGWFYLISGLWPIFHLSSFLAVTGPKTDTWLVQTVGALLAVIGITLLLASRRTRIELDSQILAAGSALTLAAIDIIFVSRGVILPIYLADAIVELLLVLAWLACALARRTSAKNVPCESISSPHR